MPGRCLGIKRIFRLCRLDNLTWVRLLRWYHDTRYRAWSKCFWGVHWMGSPLVFLPPELRFFLFPSIMYVPSSLLHRFHTDYCLYIRPSYIVFVCVLHTNSCCEVLGKSLSLVKGTTSGILQ